MAAGGGGIVFTLIPHFLENYRSRIKVLGRYLKFGLFLIWTLRRLDGTHVSVLQNGEHVFGPIGHGPFLIWTLRHLDGTHVSVSPNGEHVFGPIGSVGYR